MKSKFLTMALLLLSAGMTFELAAIADDGGGGGPVPVDGDPGSGGGENCTLNCKNDTACAYTVGCGHCNGYNGGETPGKCGK